jgi:hypothetical protein
VLLAQHTGLGGLGLGQLGIVGGQVLPQLGELPVALFKIVGERHTGLLRFSFDDGGTLRLQFGRNLVVDRLAGLGEIVLGLFESRFALAEVGFLCRELLLELPAGLGNERCGEGFRQLDFGMAVRADDLWLGHCVGPVRMGVECSGNRGLA